MRTNAERIAKHREAKMAQGQCYECGCHEERYQDAQGRLYSRCKRHLEDDRLRAKVRYRYQLHRKEDVLRVLETPVTTTVNQ